MITSQTTEFIHDKLISCTKQIFVLIILEKIAGANKSKIENGKERKRGSEGKRK